MAALEKTIRPLESKAPQQPQTSLASPFTVQADPLRPGPNGIEAEWSLVKPALRQALRDAIVANRFPVYLFGEQGRGKTCAMAALYRRVSPEPRWMNLQRFIRLIQESRTAESGRVYDFSERGHNESELWRRFVVLPELLLVDDVGIRTPSDSAFEIVYRLVNSRGKRPAIYTSNVAPDRLHEVYDGRVASRLLCGTVIHLTGDDRRLTDVHVVKV